MLKYSKVTVRMYFKAWNVKVHKCWNLGIFKRLNYLVSILIIELLILSARISWSSLLAIMPFLSSLQAIPWFLFANNLFPPPFLKSPSVQEKDCMIPKNREKGNPPLALKRKEVFPNCNSVLWRKRAQFLLSIQSHWSTQNSTSVSPEFHPEKDFFFFPCKFGHVFLFSWRQK